MSTSLKERMSSYEDTSNYKLLNKLPLVIVINGRNFNKVTSLLEKPYSSELSEVFQSPEPYVWKSSNPLGHIQWHIYDPKNGKTYDLNSEEEVLVWLEKRKLN